MNILMLNGPNLQLLGLREPEIYGKATYLDLCQSVERHAEKIGALVDCIQSNHEGVLLDAIAEALGKYDGILFNPAAYTHTSIALLDALKAVNIPTVEVHLSAIDKREDFRQMSYISSACIATITGRGIQGYLDGLDLLKDHLSQKK